MREFLCCFKPADVRREEKELLISLVAARERDGTAALNAAARGAEQRLQCRVSASRWQQRGAGADTRSSGVAPLPLR